jgi:hypothetical protein
MRLPTRNIPIPLPGGLNFLTEYKQEAFPAATGNASEKPDKKLSVYKTDLDIRVFYCRQF